MTWFNKVLIAQDKVEMLLPVESRDYTDFYSSEQHAFNVGCLFRDPGKRLTSKLETYSSWISW